MALTVSAISALIVVTAVTPVSMSRLETLIDALRGFYGALPSPPRDPFRLFVWLVLSVRTTPRKRDAALARSSGSGR